MKCLHFYLGGKNDISYFYPIESYKGDTDPECQKLATARGFNASFLAIVNYPPKGAHEVSHYTPKPEYYREQAEKIIPHYKEWEEVCLKISKQMNLAPFDAMEEFRLSAMRFYVEGLNKLFPVKTFCEEIYKTGPFWRLVIGGSDLLNDPRLDPSDFKGWEHEVEWFKHRKFMVCKEFEEGLKIVVENAIKELEEFVAMFAPYEDVVLCESPKSAIYTSNKKFFTIKV